jgi:hypothetical protein
VLDAFLAHLGEDAKVHGKPNDGGFGNSATGTIDHGSERYGFVPKFTKSLRERSAVIGHREKSVARGSDRASLTRTSARLPSNVENVTLDAALAATATLVASAFALSTFDRWLRRRRPHDGAWTVSLVLFALGSVALWWAESRGWSRTSFRVFYLAGAILNVPWLALGTVYLLGGRRLGDHVRAWLVGLSGAAVGVTLVAPMTWVDVPDGEMPKGSDVFDAAPRAFAAVGSGVAALVIIVGAVWSVVRALRGRTPAFAEAIRQVHDVRRHTMANVLIAAGTLVLSASGSFAGRLGEDRAFAVTLVVGVVVLFAGFLVASVPTRRSERATKQFAEMVVG